MLFKSNDLHEILIFILLVKRNGDAGWQNSDCVAEYVACLLASYMTLLR